MFSKSFYIIKELVLNKLVIMKIVMNLIYAWVPTDEFGLNGCETKDKRNLELLAPGAVFRGSQVS